MLLYGEELYGPSIRRDVISAEKWFNEAASHGLPVARFMGDALAWRKLGQPIASRKAALAQSNDGFGKCTALTCASDPVLANEFAALAAASFKGDRG